MQNVKTLIRMFKELIKILDGRQLRKTVCLFFSMILSSLLETLGVSVVIPFITAILSPQQLLQNKYIRIMGRLIPLNNYQNVIAFTAVAIIIVYVFKNIIILLTSYYQIKFRNELEKDLSCLMLDSYMSKPYTFFLNTNSSVIVRGVDSDIAGVVQIIDAFFVLISESITCLFIGIFLLYLSPFMSLSILTVIMICALGVVLVFKKKTALSGERCRNIFAKRYQYVFQAANGIKEITVMQRRNFFIDQYRKVAKKASMYNTSYLFISRMPRRIIEIVFIGSLLILACISVNSVTDTSDLIVQVGALAVASVRMLPAVSNISSSLNSLIYYRTALESAYDNIILAREDENNEIHVDVHHENLKKERFDESLEVKDVIWKYDSSVKDVINSLSLTIKKGEAIAFIGESGSGKTTLADVILGLLQPQRGTVMVDGMDVFSIPKQWAKIIGYVPQAVFLIDDTLRNNISFGIPENMIDDNKIWQALRQAQLEEFVQGLPNGLNTMVGERGIKFSGGQRQRVAIARALYNNPDILVLDEATSALDTETETAVMESIEALQGEKTLIIVAHRLSTIRSCDKIYEIKNGKAVLIDKKELFP